MGKVLKGGSALKAFLKVFVFLFFLSLTLYFWGNQRGLPGEKASRQIASVAKTKKRKGVSLLTYRELMLLSSKDRYKYIKNTADIIVKAGYLEGAFSHKKKKTAFQIKTFFLEEAYARGIKFCPIKGLHPVAVYEDEDCRVAASIYISADARDAFASSEVSEEPGGALTAACPPNKDLCSPLLIGFEFDSDGKAKVRCLEDASNENCFKQMRTNKDDMDRSLKILEQANPNFWTEFKAGMDELCFEEGRFKEDDESCSYVQKQMAHNTKHYSSILSSDYKDLAARLEEAEEAAATPSEPEEVTEEEGAPTEPAPEGDKHACKQFQKNPTSEMAIADHHNFDAPGMKLIVSKGQCFRLPPGTIVRRKVASNPDGSRGDNQRDTFEFYYQDKLLLDLPVGGLGDDPNRVSNVRFYNFKCGPCNDAKNLSACLFQLRKSQERRLDYEKVDDISLVSTSMDDCQKYIGNIRTREVPEVVFERVRASGASSLYEAGSLE